MQIEFSNEIKEYFAEDDLKNVINRLPRFECLLEINVRFNQHVFGYGETNTVKNILGNVSVDVSLTQAFKFDYQFMVHVLYHELFHAVEMSSLQCVVLTSEKGMKILDGDKIIDIQNIEKYRKDQKYHDSFAFEKRANAFANEYAPCEFNLSRKWKHFLAIVKKTYNEAKNPSFHFSTTQPIGYNGIEEVNQAKAILTQLR